MFTKFDFLFFARPRSEMIFGKQREKKRKRKHVKMLIKRPVKRLRWKGQPVKRLSDLTSRQGNTLASMVLIFRL